MFSGGNYYSAYEAGFCDYGIHRDLNVLGIKNIVDILHVYRTLNYNVQKLFSTNKGTLVLPLLYQDKPVTGQNSLYASAVFDKNTREIILKIVTTSNKTQTGKVIIETVKKLSSKGKVLILKSNKMDGMNSFGNPKKVSIVEELIYITGEEVAISLAPYSFYVIRVGLL